MGAAGKYTLNGIDLFTAYGFAVFEGSNPILQLRKVKKPFTNNWPEENGEEYDLTALPKYEDRVFKIKGAIIATSEADFHTKYNALFAALNVAGTLPLSCIELSKTVHVKYNAMDEPDRKTRIKGADKIIVFISLELQEVQQYV